MDDVRELQYRELLCHAYFEEHAGSQHFLAESFNIGKHCVPSHVKDFRQFIFGRRNYLVLSDFRRFMDKTKARAAFRYMDDNDSGRVGQSEVLAAVAQIFRCTDAPRGLFVFMITL